MLKLVFESSKTNANNPRETLDITLGYTYLRQIINIANQSKMKYIDENWINYHYQGHKHGYIRIVQNT